MKRMRRPLLLAGTALMAISCSDMPMDGNRPTPGAPEMLRFYVAPPGDVVVYGAELAAYGLNPSSTTGDLWAVNLTQGTSTRMYQWSADPSSDVNSPNAVAFDEANKRMYFSVNPVNNGQGDDIYVFDVVNPTLAPVKIGSVGQRAYSADFYAGSLYYVANGTSDLWKVNFGPTGLVTGEVKECPTFRAQANLLFGDIPSGTASSMAA
jgi:hypothetical protein